MSRVRMTTAAVLIGATALSLGSTSMASAQGRQQGTLQSMLGARVQFLEQQIGTARQVDRDQRHYQVGGCDFTVSVAGDEIVGYVVPMTRACARHAYAALEAYGLPRNLNLSMGEFARVRANVEFKADCLTLCGNASNPWVYLESDGLRGQPAVRAGAVRVDRAAIDAGLRIRDAIMATHGEDYVVDTRFNCSREFDALAVRELDRVKITEIAVGQTTVANCG